LAVGLFLVLLNRERFWQNFAIFLGLCGSHIVLDYLAKDTRFPYGVPFLWPLSNKYYIAPFALFLGIKRVSSSSLGFIRSLFSFHNLWAVSIEFFLLLPFLLLVFAWNKKGLLYQK